MQKVVLVVLDGWGHSDFRDPPSPGNAVEQARVPRFRELYDHHPRSRLACSGEDVGLPAGLMGNSEVGHLNLGAGRVVFQDIARVDRAVADGTFGQALDLDGIVSRLRADGGRLHVVGLVSDGGVHSHIRHFDALLDRLPHDLPLHVHCITDGRDTSPTSGAGHVEHVWSRCGESSHWAVATVTGRYWAMDRDRRWDRTRKAWRAICLGEAERAAPDPGFIRACYEAGETDEFLEPTVVAGVGEVGVRAGDALLFLNFRADRMRQICAALTLPDFDGFDRGDAPVLEDATSLTEYSPSLPIRVAFPPREIRNGLGEVISAAGLSQLRAAETEKYAHVTYFFNGGEETPAVGEERRLVPSPKVATYDLQPEMSAAGVGDAVVRGIQEDEVSFILVNFANPDMVGHTGVIPAAVRAVETVDGELGRILDLVAEREGWVALVTADHGNCEKMLTADGKPHTAHTTEPVDFMVFDPTGRTRAVRSGGRLADVAPTVLDYLGLGVPDEMTGRSLVERS